MNPLSFLLGVILFVVLTTILLEFRSINWAQLLLWTCIANFAGLGAYKIIIDIFDFMKVDADSVWIVLEIILAIVFWLGIIGGILYHYLTVHYQSDHSTNQKAKMVLIIYFFLYFLINWSIGYFKDLRI